MASCHEIRDLLSSWLDRETTPEVGSRVEAHLGECAACRAEADEMRALDALLDLEVDPGDLRERVLAATRGRWPLGWWLRVAAAALVSVGLGLAAGGSLSAEKRLVARADEAPTVLSMIDDHFGSDALAGFDELARDLQRGGVR